MQKYAVPCGVIRHVIWRSKALLVTFDGDQRREVKFKTMKRLTSIKKLESAFIGMGYRCTENTATKLVFEKDTRGAA